MPHRRVCQRQDDPDDQGDPGGERVLAEGGGGQRGEGVLEDIAEDGQADDEYDGLDRGHVPSDGEDDGGDDDQDVGRDDQVGPVGEAERDGRVASGSVMKSSNVSRLPAPTQISAPAGRRLGGWSGAV